VELDDQFSKSNIKIYFILAEKSNITIRARRDCLGALEGVGIGVPFFTFC
jgi:hypothetical protein